MCPKYVNAIARLPAHSVRVVEMVVVFKWNRLEQVYFIHIFIVSESTGRHCGYCEVDAKT